MKQDITNDEARQIMRAAFDAYNPSDTECAALRHTVSTQWLVHEEDTQPELWELTKFFQSTGLYPNVYELERLGQSLLHQLLEIRSDPVGFLRKHGHLLLGWDFIDNVSLDVKPQLETRSYEGFQRFSHRVVQLVTTCVAMDTTPATPACIPTAEPSTLRRSARERKTPAWLEM